MLPGFEAMGMIYDIATLLLSLARAMRRPPAWCAYWYRYEV